MTRYREEIQLSKLNLKAVAKSEESGYEENCSFFFFLLKHILGMKNKVYYWNKQAKKKNGKERYFSNEVK